MTFEQLYRTFFADVYRFAVWLTHDAGTAEDLTSETFIRAWVRRDRIRTETLKGYLFTIARNLFLNQRMMTAKREELSHSLPDDRPNPMRRVAARMDLDRVTAAMTRLPETDRMALVLRTEHGLSYSEIARVIEISEGGARVKVHRVRRRLLDELGTAKEKNDERQS